VYLGSRSGQPTGNQEQAIRVTPEFTRGGETLYRTASRTPEYLNRAPGRTFEYGYAGDPDYYAGISLYVPLNYEYKNTLQIWAQGSLTIIGEPVLVK
jgi:hypothetical protein